MPRNPKNRHATNCPEADDPALDEMLRRIGADILEEPVPERLLRTLRQNTEGDAPDADPAADRPEDGRPRRD